MSTGIAQLGYLGFEVSDLGAWERFATSVLGLAVSGRRDDGGLSLRMDGHHHRFLIEPGTADDLAFVGWQLDDDAALDDMIGRLRAAGVDVTPCSTAEAAHRRVERLVRFVDPGGIPSELFVGPALDAEPFRSSVVKTGFVADDRGLGHVVLSAPDQKASRDFYVQVLGFRESDRVVTDFYGYHADLVFLHTNRRHHSVAFGDRQKKRLNHFMIEARTMDEVGLAFDRALREKVKIMLTLGRHPNDRMFSFYARTPSGFQFEFGWGGRDIDDDATWETTTYDHLSEWGHHPPMIFAPPAPGAKRS